MKKAKLAKYDDEALSAKRRVVDDEGAELGELDLDDEVLADITEFMAKKGMGKKMSELFAERIGAAGKTEEELKEILRCAQNDREILRCAQNDKQEREARALLLSEAVKDGKLDNDKAAELARESKITLGDYIAAQAAGASVEEAFRAGKVFPFERALCFDLAFRDPKVFAEWMKQRPAQVNLAARGLAGGTPASVDDELNARIAEAQKENKELSYGAAYQKVLATDTELAKRYHAAHRAEIGKSAPPSGAPGA